MCKPQNSIGRINLSDNKRFVNLNLRDLQNKVVFFRMFEENVLGLIMWLVLIDTSFITSLDMCKVHMYFGVSNIRIMIKLSV